MNFFLLKYVVEYNYSARKFYEKNDFINVISKPKYYNIENVKYDAILYLKYINDG